MGTAMPGMDDDFLGSMLGDFLDESQGYLARLNENLLTLDELLQAGDGEPARVDAALLNEMFRDAHSIKGLSGMLQLTDINTLTHKLENVLDAARSDHLAVTRGVVDVVLEGVDRLALMVDSLKDNGAEAVDAVDVETAIQALLDAAGVHKTILTAQALSESLAEVERRPAPAVVVADPGLSPLAGVSDDSDVPARYVAIFVDETDESLDRFADLLTSETVVPISELMAICHRIKGGAASIGLNRVAKAAHLMEDRLQELQDSRAVLTANATDALLAVIDGLRAFVQSLRQGEPNADLLSAAVMRLPEVSCRQSSPPAATQPAPGAASSGGMSEECLAAVHANAPNGTLGFVGCVAFERGLPLVELKARLVCDRLGAIGELFFTDPAEAALDDACDLTQLVFGLATQEGPSAVQQQLLIEGVAVVDLQPLASHAAVREESNCEGGPDAPVESCAEMPSQSESTDAPRSESATSSSAAADGGDSKGKPVETLRVDIDRLDHLMNLTGQLVINKARLTQISERFKSLGSRKQSTASLASVMAALDRIAVADAGEAPDAGVMPSDAIAATVERMRRDLAIVQADVTHLMTARTLVTELGDAIHQLERVADGLQKSVMDTRMVPIGPLFGRFKRVVRDITRTNGKDVQLVLHGEKTELDKRMIDELGDPLIHMVRNSVDHGIETPEERQAVGKPPRGTVTLEAIHRGNRIVIQVRDDGRGLDPDKLKQKAVQKGLLAPADADRLTPQQALQLIWEPGFSTAEKVTEISGRGMGMDIVRSKIEQLNGSLELASEKGQGTTVTITLPLTMAIVPSLMTVIRGDVFAIPMEAVVEIVSVRPTELSTAHGRRIARVRDRIVSVAELSEVLSWQRCCEGADFGHGETTLVIIGVDGHELGLRVDDLLGEEDVVIKSLAENFRNVPGIAGASILGNGRVSLILDIAAILSAIARQAPAETKSGATPARTNLGAFAALA